MILTAIEFEVLRELRDQDHRRFYISEAEFADAVSLLSAWGFLAVNPVEHDWPPFYVTNNGHRLLFQIEAGITRYQ